VANNPAAWTPTVRSERKWKGIIVHHSLTQEGSAAIFDRYHRVEKKWENGLGYHFVINNGVGKGRADGLVEVGNRWRRQIQGAHTADPRACCNEYNENYIGICLTGNFDRSRPTRAQYASLASLVTFLQKRYGIPDWQLKGHNDYSAKSCPGANFSFRELHNELARF
jgi:N-acetyl-anhydromuramyl-L-alanine amidase AmpD